MTTYFLGARVWCNARQQMVDSFWYLSVETYNLVFQVNDTGVDPTLGEAIKL